MTRDERRRRNRDSMRRYRSSHPEAVARANLKSRLARRRERKDNPDAAREKQRTWRGKNRMRVRLYCRTWYAQHREQGKASSRRNHYKRLYGLLPGEKEKLLEQQGGMCLCCGSCTPQSRRGWEVHHIPDPSLTPRQQVRGILCHRCNTASGAFKDNPVLLRRMAEINS